MITVRTTPEFSSEKSYVFSVLLGEILGLPFRMDFDGQKPGYTLEWGTGVWFEIEDAFFCRYKHLEYLSSEALPHKVSYAANPLSEGENLVVVFGNDSIGSTAKGWYCGIDIVASSFFMLTRWEEYVSPVRDLHGRFPGSASVAVGQGFIQRPIVDEYADFIRKMLVRLGYSGQCSGNAFRLHLSHDVDHPLLWWNPADRIKTLFGALVKRRSVAEFLYWLRRIVFTRTDPYDCFDEWTAFSRKTGLVGHYHFMGERTVDSDCFYPINHPRIVQLIKKLEENGQKTGFHSSYESFEGGAGIFQRELESLKALSTGSMDTGRTHYLRFSAPTTWRIWDESGMRVDSSLGYADAPGFRCGICREFQVFDFLAQKPLRLREKPLIAMDVSLAIYLNLAPEQGLVLLQALRAPVEKYGGEFTLLWHNSSWNTPFWEPWKSVYRRFIGIE